MTLSCPVCRAENTSGSNCRRCRADLSLLEAVESRRAFHLASAATNLRDGSVMDAMVQLRLAENLQSGHDIRRTRACINLIAGDFYSALAEYVAATR